MKRRLILLTILINIILVTPSFADFSIVDSACYYILSGSQYDILKDKPGAKDNIATDDNGTHYISAKDDYTFWLIDNYIYCFDNSGIKVTENIEYNGVEVSLNSEGKLLTDKGQVYNQSALSSSLNNNSSSLLFLIADEVNTQFKGQAYNISTNRDINYMSKQVRVAMCCNGLTGAIAAHYTNNKHNTNIKNLASSDTMGGDTAAFTTGKGGSAIGPSGVLQTYMTKVNLTSLSNLKAGDMLVTAPEENGAGHAGHCIFLRDITTRNGKTVYKFYHKTSGTNTHEFYIPEEALTVLNGGININTTKVSSEDLNKYANSSLRQYKHVFRVK